MFQQVYPSSLYVQRRGTQQGWPVYDDSKSEHPRSWSGSQWDNDTLCKLPLSPTKPQIVLNSSSFLKASSISYMHGLHTSSSSSASTYSLI